MKALFTLLALLPAAAFANGAIPQSGDLVEVTGDAVALRDSTPGAEFGASGNQIGFLHNGDSVRVLETRQYVSTFGTELWVQVQKADESRVQGWVLDGISGQMAGGRGTSLRVTAPAKPATAAVLASVPGSAQPEEPLDPRDAAAAKAAKDGDRLLREMLLD